MPFTLDELEELDRGREERLEAHFRNQSAVAEDAVANDSRLMRIMDRSLGKAAIKNQDSNNPGISTPSLKLLGINEDEILEATYTPEYETRRDKIVNEIIKKKRRQYFYGEFTALAQCLTGIADQQLGGLTAEQREKALDLVFKHFSGSTASESSIPELQELGKEVDRIHIYDGPFLISEELEKLVELFIKLEKHHYLSDKSRTQIIRYLNPQTTVELDGEYRLSSFADFDRVREIRREMCFERMIAAVYPQIYSDSDITSLGQEFRRLTTEKEPREIIKAKEGTRTRAIKVYDQESSEEIFNLERAIHKKMDEKRIPLEKDVAYEQRKDEVQTNFRDLATLGTRLTKGGQLPPKEREQLYNLLVRECRELQINHIHFEHKKEQAPLVRTLGKYCRGALTETQLITVEGILDTYIEQGYLEEGTASTLVDLLRLRKKVPAVKATVKVEEPAKKEPQQPSYQPEPTKPAIDPAASREVLELFGLEDDAVEFYSTIFPAEQLWAIHESLEEAIGSDEASQLLQANPHILSYVVTEDAEDKGRTKFEIYTRKLQAVKKLFDNTIIQRGDRWEDVKALFGLSDNLRDYANIEGLTLLEKQLGEIQGYSNGQQVDETMTVDEYKDKLLRVAGYEPKVVRALVEGNQSQRLGGFAPKDCYLKNAGNGGIDPKTLDSAFRCLGRASVFTTGPGRTWRMNNGTTGIVDERLAEYMRIALHEDRIRDRHDGKIPFNKELLKK